MLPLLDSPISHRCIEINFSPNWVQKKTDLPACGRQAEAGSLRLRSLPRSIAGPPRRLAPQNCGDSSRKDAKKSNRSLPLACLPQVGFSPACRRPLRLCVFASHSFFLFSSRKGAKTQRNSSQSFASAAADIFFFFITQIK